LATIPALGGIRANPAALKGADRSLALARKRLHPPSLAHALRYTGDLYHLVRSRDALLRNVEAVFALPEEQRSTAIAANARMLLGLGLILRGSPMRGAMNSSRV
jgi:hypothetical protein